MPGQHYIRQRPSTRQVMELTVNVILLNCFLFNLTHR